MRVDAQKNIIKKTVFNQANYTAELYDDTSLLKPTLLMSWSNHYTSTFNYVYIEQFNRYYFIDDVIAQPGGAALLKCSIDVLYTYKNSILNSNIILTRTYSTEKHQPTYVKDNQFPLETNRKTEVYEFEGSTPFTTGNPTAGGRYYVLNIMGRTGDDS